MKFAFGHKILISGNVIIGFRYCFLTNLFRLSIYLPKSFKSKLCVWQGKRGRRVAHPMLPLDKKSYLPEYSCYFLAFFPTQFFSTQLITFFSCNAMREISTFSNGGLAYCTPALPPKTTEKYNRWEKCLKVAETYQRSKDLRDQNPREKGRLTFCATSPLEVIASAESANWDATKLSSSGILMTEETTIKV